ncbi:unnamed protein product [Brassica rapa subsp. narinosa]
MGWRRIKLDMSIGDNSSKVSGTTRSAALHDKPIILLTASTLAERGGERGAERGGDRGGFGRGFGERRGGRGGPRGRGRVVVEAVPQKTRNGHQSPSSAVSLRALKSRS